jgi:endonuclease-8
MPEGDTIFRAARTLNLALSGKAVHDFQTVLPKLARVDTDSPIVGRTIESVQSSGKWLSIHFSGDLILLTHMLMNGSWHVYRPGERWRRGRDDMRVLIATEDFVAVAFNVPVAEFHTAASFERRSGVSGLGPDLLAADFDQAKAVNQLRNHPELGIGEALLRQSLIAGLGNVYKSEICFACRVNPFRRVSDVSDTELDCLISTARKYLRANVSTASSAQIVTYTGFRRTTRRADPAEHLWVYGRGRLPCRLCGTSIHSKKQGQDVRITFWCPAGQAK